MSILFAGTPENAAVTLRELVAAQIPISLVLTREDAPVGRKSVLTESPVAVVARELGLLVIKSNRIDEKLISEIRSRNIDFAIVVAYGVLLSADVLKTLPGGWFNIHYSLLPRWRGAAPVQHALISGDTETGVTLFKIDKGLDTGDIVATAKTMIEPQEDAGHLLARLTHLGVSLLLEQLPRIDTGIYQLEKQSSDGVSLAPKLKRADGFINFANSYQAISNQIRGCNPEPGAWAHLDGGILKFLDANPVRGVELASGQLSQESGSIMVGAAGGAIQLGHVQPAGKKPMPATDWYRGIKNKSLRFNDGE